MCIPNELQSIRTCCLKRGLLARPYAMNVCTTPFPYVIIVFVVGFSTTTARLLFVQCANYVGKSQANINNNTVNPQANDETPCAQKTTTAHNGGG